MLPRMIGDLAHAFGDRLVLLVDALDAGKAGFALQFPVHQIVVGEGLIAAPAPQPIGCVGQVTVEIQGL